MDKIEDINDLAVKFRQIDCIKIESVDKDQISNIYYSDYYESEITLVPHFRKISHLNLIDDE